MRTVSAGMPGDIALPADKLGDNYNRRFPPMPVFVVGRGTQGGGSPPANKAGTLRADDGTGNGAKPRGSGKNTGRFT